MSDSKPRKFVFTKSTGFRLAVGFGVVVCVFGAALLIDLYNLGKLTKTAAEALDRQLARRQAGKITEIGEDLYHLQEDFATADKPDWGKVGQLEEAYDRIVRHLEALHLKTLGLRESARVAELASRAHRLSEDFYDRVVKTKPHSPEWVATPEELSAALADSRKRLAEMKRFNESLALIIDAKTHLAEYQAESVWHLSLNLSRAILGIALVVGLLVVYLTHRAIVRPIRKLVEGTKTVAGGDLTHRIEVPAPGEFRGLAESFNRMTEALQTNQKQLIEAEKMATIGRFAAGIAHEINNPIAVILGYVKTMIPRLTHEAPELEGLKVIEEEAQHCKNIVRDLLDISRPVDEHAAELVNPKDVVSDVIALARTLQLTEQVCIETSVVDRPLPMTLSRSRLRQVVLNIVSNALEALQGTSGGELRIDGYVKNTSEGTHPEVGLASAGQTRFLVLRFADNGPGIPIENLDQLPEPFFTTRSKGTGLGLAITYSIVNAHRGHIDVAVEEGKGATFIVSLPVLPQT